MYITCLCVPKNEVLMTHELCQSVLNKIKELASDPKSQLGRALLTSVFVEHKREAKAQGADA